MRTERAPGSAVGPARGALRGRCLGRPGLGAVPSARCTSCACVAQRVAVPRVTRRLDSARHADKEQGCERLQTRPIAQALLVKLEPTLIILVKSVGLRRPSIGQYDAA